MSLVRLLATGKSLIGLSQEGSRYRIPRKSPFPKFGSDKNPFTPARPDPAESADSAAPAAPARPSLNLAEEEAANLKETRRLPFVTAPVESNQLAAPSAKPGKWGFVLHALWRVIRKLNPMTKFARQPFTMTPPGPRPAKAAAAVQVQGELSLDNIKVVRNDLSDADLEVVPMKSKPAAEDAVPELPPAKNAWEFLGERLLSHNR